MSKEFLKAVEDAAEIMQFENWLRFYFIMEDEESGLAIIIPDSAMQNIQEGYPHLWELAENLNHKPIDYQSSVAQVCSFVVQKLDGAKYRAGTVSEVFDSRSFQDLMQFFNLWLQSHESQLDQSFLEFSQWRELFREWMGSDDVRAYLKEVRERQAPTPQCSSETVH